MAVARHPVLLLPRPHVALDAWLSGESGRHNQVQTRRRAIPAGLPRVFRVAEHVDVEDRAGDYWEPWLRRSGAVADVACQSAVDHGGYNQVAAPEYREFLGGAPVHAGVQDAGTVPEVLDRVLESGGLRGAGLQSGGEERGAVGDISSC